VSKEKALAASREKTLGPTREKTLGVLGGGQLGRMFVQAAQRLGLETVVFDPDALNNGHLSPAAQVSEHYIQADYLDTNSLKQLGDQCVAVTTEFENVPADALAFLAEPARGVFVSPKAAAVRIAQDRVLEKAHFAASGVPTAPYYLIEYEAHITAVPLDFYPAILKTARMGYDGKGQVTVRSAAELQAAWDGLSGVVCVLEKRMALASECSVLLARQVDTNGHERIVHWPVQTNVHVNGILATTEVASANDAVSPAHLTQQAALVEASKRIASDLDYIGVLCIEFFILADGSWVVNEVAPRPHNSGHVTMDASSMSQFEAQVRVAAGLPLVPPHQHSSVVMVNLLGDVWFESATSQSPREPDWAGVLALGNEHVGVHLHLYGKHAARRARKMGHINITAATLAAARAVAAQIQQQLTTQQLGSDPN
jgi:5-(carboxyamino)imidazole ribonucleotide synthase